MKLAFLGMGLMGAPMAANLLKAGHQLTVYNRTRAKCEPLAQQGARVADSPADAAAGQDSVHLCIEDTADVEQVLFGERGVVQGLSAADGRPPVVVDHSTISALATEQFARRLREQTGALYLDAPVSGGDTGARAGTLAIMCGGPAPAFERVRPALEAMGQTIVHVGPNNGDGQRCKMINQLVVAINCLATTEAMRFGRAMGLDMDKVLAAISRGAAGSWSLSNLGPRYLAGDFAPGFRLRHLLKDLNYCAELIAQLPDASPSDFPAVHLARELVRHAESAGHGDENIHAVGRSLERSGRTNA